MLNFLPALLNFLPALQFNGRGWDKNDNLGKGKHIEFDDVGQNTVELWTLEAGGGWVHPVHIHLVVSTLAWLTPHPPHCCLVAPAACRRNSDQRCDVDTRTYHDPVFPLFRTSSAWRGKVLTGTARQLRMPPPAGSRALRSCAMPPRM